MDGVTELQWKEPRMFVYSVNPNLIPTGWSNMDGVTSLQWKEPRRCMLTQLTKFGRSNLDGVTKILTPKL